MRRGSVLAGQYKEKPMEEEFSGSRAEIGANQQEGQVEMPPSEPMSLQNIEATLDGQSYLLGEVPQANLVDPEAFLPLNSDRLIGSTNRIEALLSDAASFIQSEVDQIQAVQKKISFWEERIEKNKAVIQKNLTQVKQNNTDLIYDKKNRDYWLGRAEQVDLDYQNAAAASRESDWSWLIKKYGFKQADGSELSAKNPSVEELCDGEAMDLSGEYRRTAGKYEQAKKDRESANNRLIRENSQHLQSNENLQRFIATAYTQHVEPLQDGVLLFKELSSKLKSLNEGTVYGEMRAWAESFLNDFIKANPRVPQDAVNEFRKLTSIPLPPENC